jgi:hypothetical protein
VDPLSRYSSAPVGVGLCVLYQVAVLGLVTSFRVPPFVLTGLIIGRGRTFVHDFAKTWLSA